MIRALVIKELRECAPLAIIATLLAAWALWVYTGGPMWPGWTGGSWPMPFVGDDFHYGPLLSIVGGLALTLGVKQTAWEDLRGTYHYLLYRPVPRRRLFLLKAIVGLALVQVLGAAMILVYALWAATPGTHASPFYWSMTKPAWQVWFVLPGVYMAAFVCGVRPARWYGSRLLPLVGCGFVAFVLVVQPWLWIAAVVGVALTAACAAVGLSIAQVRDF